MTGATGEPSAEADQQKAAVVSPAGELCSTAELRTLFLFEKLADDQLAWLCREGRVLTAEPGLVYAEGQPADFWYVLLSGTLVLSRRIGADDVDH